MACASAVIAPNPHQNDPYSTPSMNRSISTPDLIAALANLSKRSLQSSILTNLDAADVLSASQRHSSLNSSAENEASLSMERTTSRDSRNSRTSRNELTVPNEEPAHHQMQQASNGSLISFGNVQLMNNSNNLADDYERRVSLQSDTRRNLLSLQTVGRTLRQTHNQLKRTRLLHVFYFLALPIYTIIGATIFKSLDGQHDDQQMALFRMRCLTDREERLRAMESICNDSSAECFRRFRELLSSVDR